MKRIFLDHAAGHDNPNTMYLEGRSARVILDTARETIATYINASSPSQIIFAPSASLANYFLLGEFDSVAASATEHHSILHHPHTTTLLPVDSAGRVASSDFPPDADLISISLANNEIGSVEDIKSLASSAHSTGRPLHTDASAAFTKIPINVQDLDVDFLTLSGPKIGAPGIAALYAKTPTRNLYKFPFGTPVISAISHLAEVLRQGSNLPNLYKQTIRPLRDHLIARLTTEIPNVTVNTPPTHNLPNLANLSFFGAEGESILLLLDEAGISVSTGSACALGEPSHVIQAITGDPVVAHNSIRFSLGPDTTRSDIDYTVDTLKQTITTLREYTTQ